MVSSGMLRHVALVRTTWRNIPEDTILHSHHRENLKSYMADYCFINHFLAQLVVTGHSLQRPGFSLVLFICV
jgi:hypothetical protein